MKILYISTIISTIDAFLIPHIKKLCECGNRIDIAGNKNIKISTELKSIVNNIFNLSLQRTPFSFKNLLALKSLITILKENKYDVVHVHTPVASVIGRIACWLTKTRCIYTAHGFHFYKGAPLLNWLIYFPIELFLSFFTDTLITINNEDYEFAKKHLHARRIEYVPGVGIDVEKFANVKIDRNAKRRKLGIPENCKLLLSVGELNNNKNHQLVLKVLSQIEDKNIHYAICGVGKIHDYLLNFAKKLNISDKLHSLGRRNDIAEILKCADIFVHPSLREGLPVALMEAMASGLPCVASDIRGCRDLIDDQKGGYLCDVNDSQSFAKTINKLSLNPQLRYSMGNCNKERIKEFDISFVEKEIQNIYRNVLGK